VCSWLRNDVGAVDAAAGFALELVELDEHAAVARPTSASRIVARRQDFTMTPFCECDLVRSEILVTLRYTSRQGAAVQSQLINYRLLTQEWRRRESAATLRVNRQ
jgi:hypothetical protein